MGIRMRHGDHGVYRHYKIGTERDLVMDAYAAEEVCRVVDGTAHRQMSSCRESHDSKQVWVNGEVRRMLSYVLQGPLYVFKHIRMLMSSE